MIVNPERIIDHAIASVNTHHIERIVADRLSINTITERARQLVVSKCVRIIVVIVRIDKECERDIAIFAMTPLALQIRGLGASMVKIEWSPFDRQEMAAQRSVECVEDIPPDMERI